MVTVQRKRPLNEVISAAVAARINCVKGNNKEWLERWEERLTFVEREYLPSGSGIDNGTKLDLDKSFGEKLVFYTSFHHMDEGGSYDGWTEHVVTVTPSFVHRISLVISGLDRNFVKEHLHQVFHAALTAEIIAE